MSAFDPHLRLPYTLEWNFALEQAITSQQTISASYIGSVGRRLLQTTNAFRANPVFVQIQAVTNAGTSDYHSLQLQFRRRLSRGIQALASYTWAHSIDTGSAGSIAGNRANGLVPTAGNRASSDFDIHHSFSAGATYDLPHARVNRFANSILNGWSVETVIQGRAAAPVTVSSSTFFRVNASQVLDRPDLVPGQPHYLFGSQFPGGKAFNPAAFTDPPGSGIFALRQGNLPRNFLRGFNGSQWDFAAHREFPIREQFRLQFRAEMFNVLNHPNFGPPNGLVGTGGFGMSSQMLGQSLSGFGGAGGGALSPLYQIGGPRSVQVALKLAF